MSTKEAIEKMHYFNKLKANLSTIPGEEIRIIRDSSSKRRNKTKTFVNSKHYIVETLTS